VLQSSGGNASQEKINEKFYVEHKLVLLLVICML
jgi:hypothetical protein